ncbi:uncharacterized protein LOC110110664 [Dendrobium catenatum]|uniref:Uncharacterized protein n=1 Tax=Dendrobium catenatum TaxID=906689 RepID=A0A2I0X0L8_9ASPA|nr:uncharacterized protein LOC110110664 [Dendrobium catenatum]PKU81454.1 hypothetical protein MA16_Dca015859 [Dendrobium catenatum]
MDPILIEKLQAIKRSKNKKQLLLPRFIKFLLSVFSLGLFLSSPLWLPSSLPIIKMAEAMAFGPKGLFVVCNIIVLVLISESKLSNKSSMKPDIYQEYVNRNRSIQKLSGKRYNDEADMDIEKREGEVEEGADEEGYEELEELNKRVEDFIARVNKQRKLEAKMLN